MPAGFAGLGLRLRIVLALLAAFGGGSLSKLSGQSTQSAYAWGDNDLGQLGDNVTVNGQPVGSLSPVAVTTPLTQGVTAISSGAEHSVAIQYGAVYAWGDNSAGELGIGSMENSSNSPVAVNAPLTNGVTAVSAGNGQCLAILNGAVYAWGNNGYGQLGDSTQNDAYSPVAVSAPLTSGVTVVAAGNNCSYAVQDGAVYAWGGSGSGQFGNGSTTRSATPVAVDAPLTSGVTAVSAGGNFALAIQGGAVFAWGGNGDGQLGNSSTVEEHSPVAVSAPLTSGVTSVAAGNDHSLAVKDGAVYAWGGNEYGQLGNGTTVGTSDAPVQVDATDLTNIVAVTAGAGSSLALDVDGSIWVWGHNDAGELGLGTNTQSYATPQHLRPPTGYAYSVVSTNPEGNTTLAILLQPGVPVITSAQTAEVQEEGAFSYQITATGSPTSYSTSTLPGGLTLDDNGKISGTPSENGTFKIILSATNGVGPGTAALTLTIDNVPGTLNFDNTEYEVNERAGSLTVSVTRMYGSLGAIQATVSTAGGSASSGTDYVGTSATLSWSDGDTSPKPFTVPIKDLGLTEGTPRNFFLKISNASPGVALGSLARSEVIIFEDDPVQGVLNFSAAQYVVDEAGGTVTVSVTRTDGTSGGVSVLCATGSGNAQAGTDYVGVSQTLSWADGDATTKTFTVPIIDGGVTDDSYRLFFINLSDPTGSADLGGQAQAKIYIHEDDPKSGNLKFSAAAYTVDAGAGSVTVRVRRIGDTTNAASVVCQTLAGTAKPNVDYLGFTKTVSWAAGDSSAQPVTVAIIDRGAGGGSTFMFSLLLSSPTGGATLGSPAATVVTITNPP